MELHLIQSESTVLFQLFLQQDKKKQVLVFNTILEINSNNSAAQVELAEVYLANKN